MDNILNQLNIDNQSFKDSMKPLISLLNMRDEELLKISQYILEEYNNMLLNDESVKKELKLAILKEGFTLEILQKTHEQLIKAINESELSETKKTFLIQYFSLFVSAMQKCFVEESEQTIKIFFEKMDDEVKTPTYACAGDVGLDLYALDDIIIAPGETKLIHTGLKVIIPKGYELQVRPKSGRSLKTKLRVANTPGTIDSGYRDEICVIMENIDQYIKDMDYSFDDNGKIIVNSILHGSNYVIGKGEKFAQLVLCKIYQADLEEINNLSVFKSDRNGGFGSTGLN